MKRLFCFLSLFSTTLAGMPALLEQPIKLALNYVPPGFGKKHFIVGYSPDSDTDNQQRSQEPRHEQNQHDIPFNLVHNGRVKQVYFSPEDQVHKVLEYLINNEKERIRVAVFNFTDGGIAQALHRAKRRGVRVEVVVDRLCATDRFNKIRELRRSGFDVFVYNQRKNRMFPSLMHNKFVVFSKNILEKELIWTGSFNFTKSAHVRNQENVVVLDETAMIRKYARRFERLKMLSNVMRGRS